MDAFPYFLVGAISASSLFFGIFLSYVAKEEMQQGKKYFIIAEILCLSLISIIVLTPFQAGYWLSIPVALFVFFFFFLIAKARNSFLYYVLLGLLLFSASTSIESLLMASVLVFFFGLLQAALMYAQFKKAGKVLTSSIMLYALFMLFMGVPFLIAAAF